MSERILLHADRSGEHWMWTAAKDSNGYGWLFINRRNVRAHRVAYECFVGPIPPGYQIDHLCRVTSCVRPDHLEAVTPSVNVRRGNSIGARALRRDVCLHGHPYAEHGVMSCGRRICRLCRLTYMRLIKQVPYAEIMRRKREGIPVVDLAAYFAEHPVEAAA